MSTNQVNCQNCEQPHKEGFEFCPHCGQKTNDELTIGVLFYNTISNYFSFDARFLKSFIPLMIRPGYLAKEFIKGKRLLYLHPAQMYLFISVVFFFLFSFSVRRGADVVDEELKKGFDENNIALVDSIARQKIDSIKQANDSIAKAEIREALKDNKFITGVFDKKIDSLVASDDFDNRNSSFPFNNKKIDSLLELDASDEEVYKIMGLEEDSGWITHKLYAQALKFYKARDPGNILKAFYDTIPIALFFLLPIFALILKILYFRRGRYAHHLVFSFYFFSFLFTAFCLIIGVNWLWSIPDWIDTLLILSTFIYLFIALKRFYGQGWILSFLKCSVTTFTFLVMVVPMAGLIIGLIAFMFY